MTLFKRPPDLDIGPGYMHRWYVIPRNRFFNVYLHKILQSDRDEALHDHPWPSLSVMLSGSMGEYTPQGFRWISRFIPVFRKATSKHRLVIYRTAWTLFITGPRLRDWGFWCGERFVPWQKFTENEKGNTVGRGCGSDY